MNSPLPWYILIHNFILHYYGNFIGTFQLYLRYNHLHDTEIQTNSTSVESLFPESPTIDEINM